MPRYRAKSSGVSPHYPSTLSGIDHWNLTERSERLWSKRLPGDNAWIVWNRLFSRCRRAQSCMQVWKKHVSVFWENTHSFRVPISSWKYVICMKSTAALPFRSNTLNKLLMIKQIETVRNNSLHSWWMAPHIRNSWVMRLQGLFHYSI